MHVLDIGCGFGGLALFLAKRYDRVQRMVVARDKILYLSQISSAEVSFRFVSFCLMVDLYLGQMFGELSLLTPTFTLGTASVSRASRSLRNRPPSPRRNQRMRCVVDGGVRTVRV